VENVQEILMQNNYQKRLILIIKKRKEKTVAQVVGTKLKKQLPFHIFHV
jgi:hypothetical protein